MISKEDVRHLASLSRIELTEDEEKALVHDLGAILAHFDELKEIDTEHVTPMAGGTILPNQLRSDENDAGRISNETAKNDFPEHEGQLLVVPPVFE